MQENGAQGLVYDDRVFGPERADVKVHIHFSWKMDAATGTWCRPPAPVTCNSLPHLRATKPGIRLEASRTWSRPAAKKPSRIKHLKVTLGQEKPPAEDDGREKEASSEEAGLSELQWDLRRPATSVGFGFACGL